jgi:hypothetical protein
MQRLMVEACELRWTGLTSEWGSLSIGQDPCQRQRRVRRATGEAEHFPCRRIFNNKYRSVRHGWGDGYFEKSQITQHFQQRRLQVLTHAVVGRGGGVDEALSEGSSVRLKVTHGASQGDGRGCLSMIELTEKSK